MKARGILWLCLFLLLGLASPVPGQAPTPNADFNSDGAVDAVDLLHLMEEWHKSVSSSATPTETADHTPSESATPTSTEAPTDTPVNLEPYIISIPPEDARTGEPYVYHVEAVDPEGGAIAFALPIAPSGMTISATGFISWLPAVDQIGTATVQVEIQDEEHIVTEGWIVSVGQWTDEATMMVDATHGGKVEVTNPESPLFGASVEIPAGALDEDSAVQILSASFGSPLGGELFVHLEGLTDVTGEIRFNLPVSLQVLDSSPEAPLAIFVFDASNEEWIRVDDLRFTVFPGKDVRDIVGWVEGRVTLARRATIRVAVAARDTAQSAWNWTTESLGEGFYRLYEAYTVGDDFIRGNLYRFYFQSEGFVPLKGTEAAFWKGPPGRRNLIIIHGILSNAEAFKGYDDVAVTLAPCYDNILIWQYQSHRPIGEQPNTLYRIPFCRSGKLLWKQFAKHYVDYAMGSFKPSSKDGPGLNVGFPLPSTKGVDWDFQCDIIAHSMGGLVARQALEKEKPIAMGVTASNLVSDLVTLGTPHKGTTLIRLQNEFGPILQGGTLPLEIGLEVGGWFGLVDLIDNPYFIGGPGFIEYLNTPRPSISTRYWQVGGSNDLLAGQESALAYTTPENRLLISTDHSGLHQSFRANANGVVDWVKDKLGLECVTLPTRTPVPGPTPTSTPIGGPPSVPFSFAASAIVSYHYLESGTLQGGDTQGVSQIVSYQHYENVGLGVGDTLGVSPIASYQRFEFKERGDGDKSE